ncbi:cathepsin L1-like [Thrips palmi]|uniref:Cathepsin L1-like n=1 Tax=Thrips palmi TaxID=161013 RepID=A0A6P8ZMX1_THRPL|nr:cathepsin L1-like [Thrips palmi]
MHGGEARRPSIKGEGRSNWAAFSSSAFDCTMKFLIVLAAFVAVATCWSIPSEDELANHWQKFKAEHGKNYANELEETHRMKIFKENAIKVAKHNARFDAGEVTFTVAINKYADLHTHEVAERLNGYRSPVNKPVRAVHNVSEPVAFPWPWKKSVDWRKKGYVTDVKDQGQCGSCWAFSTTGSLEGALFKKNKKLVSLSEQNLVDCSSENSGCNGGLMDYAFAYIKSNGGIDTEDSYPYTGLDGSCSYSKDNSAGTLSSFVDIKQFSESDLQDAVKKVGPVSVAIDASNWSFQMYSSGVYYEPSCSSTSLDHGVLAVGYGSDGRNKDYWIVKNSWGTSWGEKGYIRMARNKKNNCGIASEASYPKA